MNKLCYLSFLLTFLSLLSKTIIRTAEETDFSENATFGVTSEIQSQPENGLSSGISSSFIVEETLDENNNIFENEFQLLLSELLNADGAKKTNFVKFTEELISDYKTKIVSNSNQSGRSFISFSMNFSNDKAPGYSLCDSFSFSLEKTYDVENTNFRKGVFEAFLINDNFDKSELNAHEEYDNLTMNQKLQFRKNHCIQKRSYFQENRNNFDPFAPGIRKNVDDVVCSDIPIPLCAERKTNGNGNDTSIPTFNMEFDNNINNPMTHVNGETVVVNGTEHQSQRHIHVQERGDNDATILQKQPTPNGNVHYNNAWIPASDSSTNGRSDENVRNPSTAEFFVEGNTIIRASSILVSFYNECNTPSTTTYNEKKIKKLIEEAGKHSRLELITPKPLNAEPALANSEFNVIDAIIHVSMKIEKSIINNNMEECKLNKYVLNELMKMAGSSFVTLSLTLVFVVFLIFIQ